MYFFFRLSERKRYQKERAPAVPVGLLRASFKLNGRKLATLKQPAVFDACPPPSALRPPVHAGEPCGVGPCLWKPNHILRCGFHAAWPAPKRRGVKRRGDFCVKNGRLSERSEFLPFSKNVLGVAPEIQRLTFFFWYLFFLRQGKKKSTVLFGQAKEKVQIRQSASPPRPFPPGRRPSCPASCSRRTSVAGCPCAVWVSR